MSLAIDQDSLPAILARAFVQAWQSYYLPERSGTISQETARPALKKLLVAMAKEGVVEEVALAAAGLRYLNSLTSKPTSRSSLREKNRIPDQALGQLITPHSQTMDFRLADVNAKFLPQWRIPWS